MWSSTIDQPGGVVLIRCLAKPKIFNARSASDATSRVIAWDI
jgi:hypothetical protein